MQFDLSKNKETLTKTILTEVYNSLQEKGYNPINQLVGYLLSGDPTYITNYNGARALVRKRSCQHYVGCDTQFPCTAESHIFPEIRA